MGPQDRFHDENVYFCAPMVVESHSFHPCIGCKASWVLAAGIVILSGNPRPKRSIRSTGEIRPPRRKGRGIVDFFGGCL
ncbi:MAG: hypothetical protein D6812_08225 [Deltaproteobacteria bacterium]|nr:MAG: hypothetical protein D6812_08225 [Deltaproteobacteria bacterium]